MMGVVKPVGKHHATAMRRSPLVTRRRERRTMITIAKKHAQVVGMLAQAPPAGNQQLGSTLGVHGHEIFSEDRVN